MNREILLSLCIPTNGILEWVVPVIESIYKEKNPIGKFEVIITDNGNNEKFEIEMKQYIKKYNNFVYKKTFAVQFQNQIEAFKLAKGKLIKFVNHRMLFLPGTLNYMLSIVKNNKNNKNIMYFSNGQLKELKEIEKYKSFDEYVKAMTYLSSWSAGVAVWKKDFEKINLNQSFNNLFPHLHLLFSEKNADEFIIINKKLMDEIPVDDYKKGHYNLFNAFAVEYLTLILNLYRENCISVNTFLKVKKDLKDFLADLYIKYIIQKKLSSYDLTGYYDAIRVYYKPLELRLTIIKNIMKKGINKIKNISHK